ncbi:MAG: tRNA (adenosine(37)-N6)-dimethylallyltransferase MiaA [Halocynthiibacter sp.]
MIDIKQLSLEKPVLIAGPTASGKSALALEIAAAQSRMIVNADALQVYDGWRILTARPSDADLNTAPHALYGHVPFDAAYSVGDWLRDMRGFVASPAPAPIIIGGTGLYFAALTEGLAEIPDTPLSLRDAANARMTDDGIAPFLAELDAETRAAIDTQNPMRVQRAWEVLTHTGRSIRDWQRDTPPPLLGLENTHPFVLTCDKIWLNERIERRFHQMIDQGALDEARSMLPNWSPDFLSSKAIGAPELIAHLQGDMDIDAAIEAAIIGSRQYAKRQRSWFRSRMKSWTPIQPDL